MKTFRRKSKAPAVLLFIGLAFTVLGLIASLGVARPQIVKGNETLRWPSVQGVITAS